MYGIQDFPYTGCGLGTFRRVVHILYPLFLVAPDVDIGHAHNLFLQVALDLGVPGLIAYVALLVIAAAMCWQVYHQRAGPERALALGLGGGLLAQHVYGLTDAVALGAKHGVALWMLLGLVVALHRMTCDAEGEGRGRYQLTKGEGGRGEDRDAL